jgi:stearoyl-CoA 9-desaturase NADPH oxidoreductase
MFRLAPPRARRGGLLRAVTALTTPLLPEDYLGLVDPLWSVTELRGRVVAVQRETARATTLTIRPGRMWTGHRAGQYARIGVDIDGVRHWRTYSISSAEGEREIRITVQAHPGGVVSGHLAHRTTVGTIVRLESAMGEFVLPSPVPAKLLMITAGSGITPVMGMLRTLAHRGERPDVVVVHSARTPEDVIFGRELRAMPGITFVEHHTGVHGRLDLAGLHDVDDRAVFVCGPDGLLDAAQERFGERVVLERFTPPSRSAGGEGGSVAIGGTTVEVDGASSLLEAGEAAGLLMPSGCRMGICHGCLLPLRDGQVRDLRTGELHGEPGDLVQTCINGASGSAAIDLTS